MNEHEKRAAEYLQELSADFGLIGVKTSFEDEGVSFEEVIRVKEMCKAASCELHLKIGGAEAVRDLRDAMTLGVDRVVAPMIESPFALQKFVMAYEKYVSPYDTFPLGINIETISAIDRLKEILDDPMAQSLDSLTIGRCDLIFSQGKDRTEIHSDSNLKIVESGLKLIKQKGFTTFMGGAVSQDSIPCIEKYYLAGILDCVETRYAIFDVSKALTNLSEGLHLAHLFEIELLKSKRLHYQAKFAANDARLKMIESRIERICVAH